MKLLFDQNLSFKLCKLLSDLFPDSDQVRRLGLDRVDDRSLWQFARDNGYVLVTHDADFVDFATLRGSPPKVVLLRCGNCTVAEIEALLRSHSQAILALEDNESTSCLELYG